MVALQANIYFTSCIYNQSLGCINSPGESSEDAVKALSGSLLSQPRPSGSAHDPEEKADFNLMHQLNKIKTAQVVKNCFLKDCFYLINKKHFMVMEEY